MTTRFGSLYEGEQRPCERQDKPPRFGPQLGMFDTVVGGEAVGVGEEGGQLPSGRGCLPAEGSCAGGEGGGMPYVAEAGVSPLIEPVLLEKVRLYQRMIAQGEQAKIAAAAMMDVIVSFHKLEAGDGIDIESGRITRGPR